MFSWGLAHRDVRITSGHRNSYAI